jgi:hypothetical protein
MNSTLRAILATAVLIGIFLAGGLVGGIVIVHVARGRLARYERAHQEEQAQRVQEQQKLVRMIEDLRTQQLQQQKQLTQWHSQQHGRPSPERFGPQLMRRFVNQVQATPEDREKIRPLGNTAAEELRRLQRDTTHHTEMVLEQLEDQIAAVLTPAQRDHFNDMVQNWRSAFQKYNLEQQQRQAEARVLEQQRRQQASLPALAPARSAPAPAAPVPAPDTVAK